MKTVNEGVMRMLMSIRSHNGLRLPSRCLRLVAAAAAAAATLAIQGEPAVAHDGPAGTFDRCASRIGGGDSWETFNGVVHGQPFSAEQFYVRIVPAAPFGWSGTVNINNQPDHPTVWIPVSSSHWFPSPAIFTGSSGNVFFSVTVKPNQGVFNNYSMEIYSPRTCAITS
jgi:hypothetical protein